MRILVSWPTCCRTRVCSPTIRDARHRIAVEAREVSLIAEITVAHRSRRNHRMVDAVVHVLLVILKGGEKEELVAVVVEICARNDQRATNLAAGIEILCLRPRNV